MQLVNQGVQKVKKKGVAVIKNGGAESKKKGGEVRRKGGVKSKAEGCWTPRPSPALGATLGAAAVMCLAPQERAQRVLPNR